jgi:hypothetical protein
MSGLCLTRRTKFKTDVEPEPKSGSVSCYVCGRRIQIREAIGIGNGMYRHKRCRPGTNRWLANMESDPFRRYFVGDQR